MCAGCAASVSKLRRGRDETSVSLSVPMALLSDKSVRRVEFYCSCSTMVAYDGDSGSKPLAVVKVATSEFPSLLTRIRERAMAQSSHFGKKYRAPGGSESALCAPDHVPELTSPEMGSLVDLVVKEATHAKPEFQKIPAEVVDRFVINAKTAVSNQEGTFYSRAQAIKFMEVLGKMCGELILQYT